MVSDITDINKEINDLISLNPCFNGIWSRTNRSSLRWPALVIVLILVLMEYGLGQSVCSAQYCARAAVLILVLMEYGLGRWHLSSRIFHHLKS